MHLVKRYDEVTVSADGGVWVYGPTNHVVLILQEQESVAV